MSRSDAAISQTQQRSLCLLVKQVREAVKRTQLDFAAELTEQPRLRALGRTITRHRVNRIENGHAAVDVVLAQALDDYVAERGLPECGFAHLASAISEAGIDNERGRELRRLLGTRDLEEVHLVTVDLTDYALYMRLIPRVPELTVTMYVPSPERIRELFGQSNDDSRAGAASYDGYGDRLLRHVWDQVRRMHRIAGGREDMSLEVVQVNTVLNPVVVARHGRHMSCLHWPPTPVPAALPEPDIAPCVGDAGIAAWYREQLLRQAEEARSGASAEAATVHLGDLVLRADPLDPPERLRQCGQAEFLRFLPRAAPRRRFEHDRDESTVVALSLMLPYIHSIADGFPTVELLLRKRELHASDAEPTMRTRLSFLSTWVTASAMWQVLDEGSSQDDSRPADATSTDDPTLGLIAAGFERCRAHLDVQSREFTEQHFRHSNPDGAAEHAAATANVIELAYRRALCDELELMYNLHRPVALSRLSSTEFTDLRVRKNAGADVFARLYAIELAPHERDWLIDNADRYMPSAIARFTVPEVRTMMGDIDRTRAEFELSDCLELALSHAEPLHPRDEPLQAKFARLLDRMSPRHALRGPVEQLDIGTRP